MPPPAPPVVVEREKPKPAPIVHGPPKGKNKEKPPRENVPKKKDDNEGVLTTGQHEALGKFERIDLLLPSLFRVHALGDAAERQKLAAELRKENALRV